MNFPFSVRRLRGIAGFTRRRALDLQLAAGIDPHSDAALERRAAHLCRKRVRRHIARRLGRTIAAARTASSDRMGFAALARSTILAKAAALTDLVSRLEAGPGTLHIVVRLATAALDISPRRSATARER